MTDFFFDVSANKWLKYKIIGIVSKAFRNYICILDLKKSISLIIWGIFDWKLDRIEPHAILNFKY